MLYNKIDALPVGTEAQFDVGNASMPVSARTGQGLDVLLEAVASRLGVTAPTEVLLPPEAGRTRAWLYRLGAVLSERVQEDGSLALMVQADQDLLSRLSMQPRVLLQGLGRDPRIPVLPGDLP